jgi:hypothetical protein
MGSLIKASSVRDGHSAMRAEFGDTVFDQAISLLSADDQAVIAALGKSTMYPLAIDGRLQQHLVDIGCNGSRQTAEKAFRRAAGIQAERMLDGVFSVFARFVSPAAAFARGGTIIASAYQGVSSSTIPATDGPGGTMEIRGLEDLTYASPWLCGWMEQALIRFGATTAKVTERTWLAGQLGASHLIFDITWT